MGSGITFFTNAIDVTPGVAGSWQQMNLAAHLTEGSSGAVFMFWNDSSYKRSVAVRKNGQAHDFATKSKVGIADNIAWGISGVDAARICEGYIELTGQNKILLIGECDDNVVFLAEPVDISIGATSTWTEINCSGSVPAGATGVIVQIINKDVGSSGRRGLVRCKDSTDDFSADGLVQGGGGSYGHTTMIVACDADRKIEGYINDTDVDFYLVGYTKSPITMFVNGVNMNMGTADAWTEKDITALTSATADGAIFIGVNMEGGDDLSVRKEGSSDDYYKGQGDNSTNGMWCGLNAGVFEFFTGDIANLVLRLTGYCEPEGGVTYDETGLSQTVLVAQAQSDAQVYRESLAQAVNMVSAGTDLQQYADAVEQALLILQSRSDLQTYNTESVAQVVALLQSRTDVQAYLAESLAQAILIVASESDQIVMLESLQQSITIAQSSSDRQVYADAVLQTLLFGHAVTDKQAFVEAVLQALKIEPSSTDAQQYKEATAQLLLLAVSGGVTTARAIEIIEIVLRMGGVLLSDG